MKTSRIHISIAFGDAILPVVQCDDGHQRVPLKPISDQVGLDWKSQRRKIKDNDYLTTRFGLILGGELPPKTLELRQSDAAYLIRIDRVTAFLNSLNPHQIRSNGNHDAADWLEAKHEEWDDAIHAYETNGFAAKPGRSQRDAVSVIRQIDLIKNPALKQVAAKQANHDFGLDIPIGKQQGLEL
jgi:hypothetical protein